MKYILFSILILGGTFSSCISDKLGDDRQITVDMIDPENPPVLEFEEMEFDFGKIAQGSTMSHSFKFVNTGKSPLIIHSVKASCGCTVLKNWPKKPVLSGESGEIPVEFTPKSIGNQKKYISIIANTAPSTSRLYLVGEVLGVE